MTLTDDDIRGESFYNDLLADTVAELEEQGIAVESEGALCAFPPGFTGREGRPLPLIIRKSDGGYNYATTDLATVRYRVDKLSVDRAIYVVGSEQALHFQMVFAVARQAGWIPAEASFEHAQIGMVLGPDGNRLRTRDGRDAQAQRPARRRASTGPAASSTSSTPRPGSTRPSWTRSPRRSASARSSTPTCRPRGRARTSSTGTG